MNTEGKDAVDFMNFRKYQNLDASPLIDENNLFEFKSEDAIRKYIMMNLESVPLANLPIRCYNYQNKKVIIKIDGKWYRANDKETDTIVNYAKSKLSDHCFTTYEPIDNKFT